MRSLSGSRLAGWIGLAIVVLLFGLPLFHGLGNRDLHNDEASYSYGVQRILETNNWLTIRGTPDMEFLEKPPLKFWLVAAGMRLGILPRNDTGMRSVDALFGVLIWIYVYLISRRIGGVVAGVTAVMLLFTFGPLIFEHGLRSNNMEAALTLAYCAGYFHVLGWIESRRAASARAHAFAAALAFVLGFMTKFVVIVFLPAGALWLLVTHPARRELMMRSRLMAWIGPAALAIFLSAPWFVYQTMRIGREFWNVILGQQVLKRATSGLDASHLEGPWFYFLKIVNGFGESGTLWIVIGGLLLCLWMSLKRDGAIARLLMFWAVVPLVAFSLSRSKLIHYSYPFIPPLAIMGGWLVGVAVNWLVARAIPDISGLLKGSPARWLLFTAGLAAAAVASATLILGRIVWHLPFDAVLSNGSVARPAIAAVLLLVAATREARGLLLVPMAFALSAILPLRAYSATLRQTEAVYRPLSAINDCVKSLAASGVPEGTYLPVGLPPTHAYYYYLREFGPYVIGERSGNPQQAINDRFVSGHSVFLVLPTSEYLDLIQGTDAINMRAIQAEDNFALVLPGATAACSDTAIKQGALRGSER